VKQSTKDIVEPLAIAGGIFVLGWLLVRKSARARAQEQPFQIEPSVQPPPELQAPVQLNGGCAPCAAAAATRGFYY